MTKNSVWVVDVVRAQGILPENFQAAFAAVFNEMKIVALKVDATDPVDAIAQAN